MKECLHKRLLSTKLVSTVWTCPQQNHQHSVDISGTDLRRLRQRWETATDEECYLNDNVHKQSFKLTLYLIIAYINILIGYMTDIIIFHYVNICRLSTVIQY